MLLLAPPRDHGAVQAGATLPAALLLRPLKAPALLLLLLPSCCPCLACCAC